MRHRRWRLAGAVGLALLAFTLKAPRPVAQTAPSAIASMDDGGTGAPARLGARQVAGVQSGRPSRPRGNARNLAGTPRLLFPRGEAAHRADAAAAELGPSSTPDETVTVGPMGEGPAAPSAPAKTSTSVSYDGLNIVDNASANQFDPSGHTNVTPPDNATCINGPRNYSVQLLNLVAGSFDNSKGKPGPQLDLNAFFSSSAFTETEAIFDPRCFYDQAADVWFFTATSETHMDLEVVYDNGASDAGSFWSLPYAVWQIDTASRGFWEDNPALAVTDEVVYMTGNAFAISDGSFRGADYWMLSRTDLLAASATPATLLYGHWSGSADDACGSTGAFLPISALRPAQAPIPDPTQTGEVLLSSFDPRGCGGVFNWAFGITNEGLVNTCPTPTNGFGPLCPRVVAQGASFYNGQPFQNFYIPPSAIQKNSGAKLDTDDDRLWQVTLRQGTLYTSLTTAVNLGETVNRSGVAWWTYSPVWSNDSNGAFLAGVTSVQQGIFGLKGSYLMYPALAAADGTGHMAMFMSLSGSSYYPSAVAAAAPFGTTSLATLGSGFTAYVDLFTCNSGLCRFGDYSSAVTVPGSRSVWGSAEYVSNQKFNTTNWATKIGSITP
jgi:hypothetical protein